MIQVHSMMFLYLLYNPGLNKVLFQALHGEKSQEFKGNMFVYFYLTWSQMERSVQSKHINTQFTILFLKLVCVSANRACITEFDIKEDPS